MEVSKTGDNAKALRKKILFINLINLSDILLEKDVVLIPKSFRKLGFEIYYVVRSNEIGSQLDFIDIIEIPRLNFASLSRSILHSIRKIKPEIIFMYPLWRNQLLIDLMLILYRKISRKNIVIILKLDFDGDLDSIPKNKILTKIYFFLSILTTDVTIIESNEAKNKLLSYYNKFIKKILAKKIYVMYNGLSTELIQKYKDFMNRYERSNKILVNARVTEVKGLYEFILALGKIKDEIKDWKVHIVGPIEDEGYYLKLKSVIDSLGLNDKIVFLGKLNYEDLIKEYVTSKIFVLPSKKEGFSIARLNAMAACLPIVTTNTGGAEIVRDCCGIIVPVNDVNSLSEALKKLVKDSQLREIYSRNACEKINSFNFDKLVKDLLNYLKYNHLLRE